MKKAFSILSILFVIFSIFNGLLSHTKFASLTKYTFQITSGKDLDENDLVNGSIPNPWWFTTEDSEAPTMLSVSPTDGSLGILQKANIVVTFSETMDTETLTFTCMPNPSGWAVVWAEGDTIATFMHDAFDRNTTYTIQVTKGKDLAGNMLEAGNMPNPWSFKTELNQPPVILSEPVNTAQEDNEFMYNVECYDPNNDKLTYSLTTHPFDCAINSSTGEITWTPSNDQVGENSIVIMVTDGYGGVDTQKFSITVENVNDPPEITSTPITSAKEGSQYTYKLEASDIDIGDVLTYSLESAPTSMTINSASGIISWLPSRVDVGQTMVIAMVSDSSGGTDTQSFTITVTKTNAIPSITSQPLTIAIEDIEYSYNVEVLDIDVEDILTYKLLEHPTGMVIDEATGLITWFPSNDDVGTHQVKVSITDNVGGYDAQVFNITVENVNDPPTITSTPVTTAFEDEMYTYEVKANDVDPTEDTLTYSLTTYPAGMTIEPKSGVITWVPTKDQTGFNNVMIVCSDGNDDSGTALQMFAVNVINIKDPPEIISTPVTKAVEDEQYIYDVDAVDDDPNEILIYSLEKYPLGMVIDGYTGVITWIPTNEQVGTVSVTVKVVDREAMAVTQSFTITVDNSNNDPEITSTPVTTAKAGLPYIYDVDAADPDPTDDSLTFSLVTYPSGMAIDPKTGVITWTPTKDHGILVNIVVLVTDGSGGSSAQSYLITVEAEDITDDGSEVTTEKDTQESAAVYGILIALVILILILVFLLFAFFRKGERADKPDSKENNK